MSADNAHAYLPWIRPNLRAGERGACAVVIGVSRYWHLPAENQRRTSRTFNLGQLGVSALTAYRFFQWLRDSYRYQGQRLTHCWLLLAPTEAEILVEPELAHWSNRPDGAASPNAPTFLACEAAILAWAREVSQLQDNHHARSFFFFSGHGLEANLDSQILLPCDYLGDDNPNRAISVNNLKAGLAARSVREQFFFIDACRNDHVELRRIRLTGSQILAEAAYPVATGRRLARTAPVFYASAWGEQAWQPRTPAHNDDLTFYGKALLEGLELRGPLTPRCDGPLCTIDIFMLQAFLEQRLSTLLRQRKFEINQSAVLGGSITNMGITEVALPEQQQRAQQTRGRLRPEPEDYAFYGQLLEQFKDQELAELFGDSRVGSLWRRARLYHWGGEDWLEAGRGLRLWRLTRREHQSYEVELSVAGALGTCMLQLGDMLCWLPDYDHEAPRYLLGLVVNRNELGAYVIGRLTAGLAPSNPIPLRALAGSELADAAHDPGRLTELLAAPGSSRLATALAAGLLFLLDRPDQLAPAQLDRLAKGRQAIAEGPLLHWRRAQTLGSLRKLDQLEEDHCLSKVARLGLPMLSGPFAILLEMAQRRTGPAEPEHGHTVQDELLARVREVAAYLRPGGLFTVFQAGQGFSQAAIDGFPERWLPLPLHKPDRHTLLQLFGPESPQPGERTRTIFQE